MLVCVSVCACACDHKNAMLRPVLCLIVLPLHLTNESDEVGWKGPVRTEKERARRVLNTGRWENNGAN